MTFPELLFPYETDVLSEKKVVLEQREYIFYLTHGACGIIELKAAQSFAAVARTVLANANEAQDVGTLVAVVKPATDGFVKFGLFVICAEDKYISACQVCTPPELEWTLRGFYEVTYTTFLEMLCEKAATLCSFQRKKKFAKWVHAYSIPLQKAKTNAVQWAENVEADAYTKLTLAAHANAC